MKFNIFIISVLSLLIFSSCDKELHIASSPDLDVTLDKSTYKVGEEVLFKFTGFAEIVSFYSGEVYNDYAFKDGRVVKFEGNEATLSFNSGVREGSQENQLSVLISNDFGGDTSSLQSVKAATWIDITESLTLGDSDKFVPSGKYDLSEFTESNPIYVAFKYVTKPQLVNGDARIWMVENFVVESKGLFDGSPLNYAQQSNVGFYTVNQDRINSPARNTATSTRLSMLGNDYEDPEDPKYDPENPIYDPENPIYDPNSDIFDPQAEYVEFEAYDPNDPLNDPSTETWIVSRPIFTSEVDLGRDWAEGIRDIQEQKLVEHTHTYSKPGTYKAVFIGKNATVDESEEVVRELKVTIEP